MRFLESGFFHQTTPPGPTRDVLEPFLATFRGVMYILKRLTGFRDTGSRWFMILKTFLWLPVSQTPGNLFKLYITPRKLEGSGEFVWRKKSTPKISCYCPFKVGMVIHHLKPLFKLYHWLTENFKFIKGLLHNLHKKCRRTLVLWYGFIQTILKLKKIFRMIFSNTSP